MTAAALTNWPNKAPFRCSCCGRHWKPTPAPKTSILQIRHAGHQHGTARRQPFSQRNSSVTIPKEAERLGISRLFWSWLPCLPFPLGKRWSQGARGYGRCFGIVKSQVRFWMVGGLQGWVREEVGFRFRCLAFGLARFLAQWDQRPR